MKKFIVLVLDSFGIGEMDDVKTERPQDMGANTYRSVLKKNPNIHLDNLKKLGLANAAALEIGDMKPVIGANYGVGNLKHFGCDTFYGHHELMGTLPKKPVEEPFRNSIDRVEKHLLSQGYSVERFGSGEKILLVNSCVSIGDNLEADLGQVYNVTGTFQKISYEKLIEIGRAVREVVKVPRVITFGGTEATFETIKAAYISKDGRFAGVSAPLSKVYEKGYQVIHMGYGIDAKVQLPTIIGSKIPVTLIGKVADIVENPFGNSIPAVDTEEVMKFLVRALENDKDGFICANVQETDLAGHQQNSLRYGEKLKIADNYLKKVMEHMGNEDILIVTADHGNDPEIGHSNHTRERVPILIYSKNIEGKGIYIGERETLGDIGQTAAEYFGFKLPENGASFLKTLKI